MRQSYLYVGLSHQPTAGVKTRGAQGERVWQIEELCLKTQSTGPALHHTKAKSSQQPPALPANIRDMAQLATTGTSTEGTKGSCEAAPLLSGHLCHLPQRKQMPGC